MKLLLLLSLLFTFQPQQSLFDFGKDSSLRYWGVVNDGVMGGLSNGTLYINDVGHGVFEGRISLQNNGGFSSIRHVFEYQTVDENALITLKVKGDGKPYEFRVKHDRRSYYSYVYSFETSGEWEEITIPLKDMKPAFRGRDLNMPNFDKNRIGEITFLFGNKKAEPFRLLIDEIRLL